MAATHAPFTLPSSHLPSSKGATTKYLTLCIESLTLVVSLGSVYRILSNTNVHNTGQVGCGIAHLDELEISVMDLHHHLFKQKNARSGDGSDGSLANYLVIIQSLAGELFGIPVDRAPTLLDVPIATIRKVPDTYRQVDTLGIASHMAVIEGSGKHMTVFVLDIEGFMKLACASTLSNSAA